MSVATARRPAPLVGPAPRPHPAALASRAVVAAWALCTAFGTLAALGALLAASGCGDNAPGPPDSCLPDCAGRRDYDAQGYALSGRFDWSALRLIVSEDITLTLPAGGPAVVELDARVEVSSVHAGEQLLAFTNDPTDGTLRVDLSPLGPTAEPITFTVEYRAQPSDSLIPTGPRDDDPVASRVVFTDSEPDRGLGWLVAKHDPSDRARFAVTLTVDEDEDVIANGARRRDETSGSSRVVGYVMDQAIPTYLMAFAAGQIVHTDRAWADGRVPLSLWHRRGLAVDAQRHLDVIAEALAAFEQRLGPYPWDSYAVVLVPGLGGGMENATITFNNELTGQGAVSFGLNAHELGHQWFGDWVTMRRYQDVWIKEGMATLLAAEAQRGRRDLSGSGRRFGTDFTFDPSDAVVDNTLSGLGRYTSGPYERAAWMLTQIRARVGEDAFWATLRQILADHALGSIDGEAFLAAFASALDQATIDKLTANLEVFEVPVIDAAVASAGAQTEVTLTLSDPGGVLIAPVVVTVVDAVGAAVDHPLAMDTAVTVTVPAGGYLALDESDTHPYWDDSFAIGGDGYEALFGLLRPSSAATRAAFLDRSPAVQERTLREVGLPPDLGPADLGTFVAGLDSLAARRSATFGGCSAMAGAAAEPDQQAAWAAALTPLIKTPAIDSFSSGYARCGAPLAEAALGPELDGLLATASVAQLARLEYLLAFDYGAAKSFTRIGAVATTSPSLRLRDQALGRLVLQTGGFYSAIAAADQPVWSTFFRTSLASVSSSGRLRTVWRGIRGLADLGALPLVAPLLHTVPQSGAAARQLVCEAFALTQDLADGPAAWTAFQNAAQPWDALPSEARAALADPATCAN
jgi:hypothetical protein